MKFCLKQKIVTNPPPIDRIEKVSGVTEYEALRAEKLFRYEYSNQLNTSLLTFAFTVFTAGLIIFTLLFQFGGIFDTNSTNDESADYSITINDESGNNKSKYQIEITDTSKNNDDYTYVVFVEYFFACFFLLPCFFSGINFRYTLKNSLRIGQLTDYIREKIVFDDGESWESFKRDYNTNYFYKKPTGVGGATDIPKWINIISITISCAIGIMGIHYLCNKNPFFLNEYYVFICHGILFIIAATIKISAIKPKIYLFILYSIYVVGTLGYGLFMFWNNYNIDNIVAYFVILVWLAVVNACVCLSPKYKWENDVANCILDYTRVKLKYVKIFGSEKSIEQRNIKIFSDFLQQSETIKRCYQKKSKRNEKYIKSVLLEVDINNMDLELKKKKELTNDYFPKTKK